MHDNKCENGDATILSSPDTIIILSANSVHSFHQSHVRYFPLPKFLIPPNKYWIFLSTNQLPWFLKEKYHHEGWCSFISTSLSLFWASTMLLYRCINSVLATFSIWTRSLFVKMLSALTVLFNLELHRTTFQHFGVLTPWSVRLSFPYQPCVLPSKTF